MGAEGGGVERAYAEIKRQILEGELRLRQRLDIEALARELKLSITPIRSALTRLSNELLVTGQGGRGYFVKMWSERELGALYDWRGALTLLALGSWRPDAVAAPDGVEARYDAAFLEVLQVLARNANPEIVRAALSADERLSAAIRAEPEIIPGAPDELRALIGAMAFGDKNVIARLLRDMFSARSMQAREIRARAALRALPPNGS